MNFLKSTYSVMHSSYIFIFCALNLLFTACAPYKISTEDYVRAHLPAAHLTELNSLPLSSSSLPTAKEGQPIDNEIANEIAIDRQVAASRHWLYRVIPRHRSQIRWFDVGHWLTWGFFGNDDDGLFGEELSAKYHFDRPIHTSLAFSWGARNPLHNFCFYVIGQAYRQNSQITLLGLSEQGMRSMQYKAQGSTVFEGKEMGLYIALNGFKPFISLHFPHFLQRKTEVYFGWRERGNFGLKFRPATKQKQENQQQGGR